MQTPKTQNKDNKGVDSRDFTPYYIAKCTIWGVYTTPQGTSI